MMLLKIWELIVLALGRIHWPTKRLISQEDQDKIRSLLTDDHFIILTYRRNYLSSYLVRLANLVLTGRYAQWSHALINLEDDVHDIQDFRLVSIDRRIGFVSHDRALIEATGDGSVISPFEKAFDVHGVALLKPRGVTLDEWRHLAEAAKAHLGRPYDTLFDLADDQRLSCVELVRLVLLRLPGYHDRFRNLENMIRQRGNLTPQMFYDCGDFEVVFEAHA